MNLVTVPYSEFEYSNPTGISDHLNGIWADGYNSILEQLNSEAKKQDQVCEVVYHQWLPEFVHQRYSNLDIKFDSNFQREMNFAFFDEQTDNVKQREIKRFLFTALGSPHDGRKLLCGTMMQRGLFELDWCQKNMSFTVNELDNLVVDLSRTSVRPESVNHKLFVHKNEERLQSIQHGVFDMSVPTFQRLWAIEQQLTSSFVHVVSETISTSYAPFVTEKFLYSVYAEGLFVACAQPGWHRVINEIYGFRLYNTVFDYEFDSIQNPLDRLTELFGMLSKYKHCNSAEWQQLREQERENIEFNKQHLLSKDYLTCAQRYDTWQNGNQSGRATAQDLLQFEQLVKGKVYG